MRIQSDKLVQLIRNSELGTGTLSKVAKIHPDELQKLIALSEGSKELVERVEGILGEPFREHVDEAPVCVPVAEGSERASPFTTPPPGSQLAARLPEEKSEANSSSGVHQLEEKASPPTPLGIVETHTVNEIISLVESGEHEPASLLEAEAGREVPRSTLTDWLREQMSIEEEVEKK